MGASLLAAIAVQVSLIVASVVIIIGLPEAEPERVFTAPRPVTLPQRQLEHVAEIAAFQQAAGVPSSPDILTTDALLPSDLPPAPSVPETAFTAFETSALASETDALFGTPALGAGLDGLDSDGAGFSFLGIEDRAARMVIAFDISTSVVNNMQRADMDIDLILDETKQLVNGLSANTLVGLIQFSRSYDCFADYPVPATQANKVAITAWLDTEFVRSGISQRDWKREEPNGVQSVLKRAFAMEPDVIILLSDGSFQRNRPGSSSWEHVPWEEVEDGLGEWQETFAVEPRIHFVGFGVKDSDAGPLRSLVVKTDGHYKEY